MARAPYQKSLGEAFRAAREIQGLRVKDLAAISLLGEHVITRAEKDRPCQPEQYDAIERALGIAIRQIFEGWSK